MPKQSTASKPAQPFVLPPVVTIDTVEEIAAVLRQIARQGFVLDVSQLQTITTPGLQLILALDKITKGTLTIIGDRSGILNRVFQDAGLEALSARLTQEETQP
ncbi:MAG: STAS domain-containing protein [Alphaproteobacteria bacterium]|nr:STAS domain-containing protein [Alphaproteobacteria bacterium]